MANLDSLAATLLQATGRSEDHLIAVEGLAGLFHVAMVDDLRRLQAAAASAGFQLAVASSFRSFDRQLAIWRAKAEGQRPLLDSDGLPLVYAELSEEQRLWAIMRWSAIPGASRHHWGTDIDVFDGAGIAPDKLQLIPQEYCRGGPCAGLSDWLDEVIASDTAFGFFRPYDRDRGGVAPEPWHLSYRPVAQHYLSLWTPEHLLPLWRSVDLPLLAQIEASQALIFSRYIHNL